MKWYLWLAIGILYFIIAVFIATIIKRNDKIWDYKFPTTTLDRFKYTIKGSIIEVPPVLAIIWPMLVSIYAIIFPIIMLEFLSDELSDRQD